MSATMPAPAAGEPAPATGDAARIALAPILDIKAAEPLARELLGHRGQPLQVDASQVQRLGGLCLQVLLSAQATWESDAAPLAIVAASDAFAENLKLFGADKILRVQGDIR